MCDDDGGFWVKNDIYFSIPKVLQLRIHEFNDASDERQASFPATIKVKMLLLYVDPVSSATLYTSKQAYVDASLTLG